MYEIPPNGQGIVALIALNILEGMHLETLEHNSTEYLHAVIEVRCRARLCVWPCSLELCERVKR